MTPRNIVPGFAVTGIYPLDRNALDSVEKCPEKHRLPFIPLFTPSKRVSLTHLPARAVFSRSELERFQSFNRCNQDLKSARYQHWLYKDIPS